MRIRPFAAVLALALAHAGASAAGEAADAGITDDAGTPEAEAASEPAPAAAPAATTTPPARSEDSFHRFTLGAYAGLGMAHAIVSKDSEGARPRFAGAGGAYVDLRLSRWFAFDVGVDLVGKGCLINTDLYRFRILVLEIPLGVKLYRDRFVFGIALGIDVGLTNSKRLKDEGDSDFGGEEIDNWDDYERFNLSPRLAFGYAIPVGRIALVPGIAWSMEALNAYTDEHTEYHDWQFRDMNLMITLGAELGFGARETPAAPAPAKAELEEPFDRFAVGAYASFGIAYALMKNVRDSESYGWDETPEPRFAGGGGAYFDFYPAEPFALDVGIEFIGKGYRYPVTSDRDEVHRLRYLEIPLGVKLDLWGVRIGAALALGVALFAEHEFPEDESTSVHPWEDARWSSFRRVNFGPRLSLGYAIRVRRIAIVPGATWSMDILDNAKSDADGDFEWRSMNLMFSLGVEYGFGGGAE